MDIADVALRTGILEARVAVLWEGHMGKGRDERLPWMQIATIIMVSLGSLAAILSPDKAPTILSMVGSVLKTFGH